MAVRIRLKRIGKNPKKRPHFRVSVFDEVSGRDSRCIEELGFYSPLRGEVKIKKERLDYWVKNGAQVSEALKNIIKKAKKEE
ncbi:MAG: 30S ribosomal protein S16 [Candidatus Omnitrophica bacterium]|nr:30S ribosomal protein S16 [Candidatus Omnitrophota bacterium]